MKSADDFDSLRKRVDELAQIVNSLSARVIALEELPTNNDELYGSLDDDDYDYEDDVDFDDFEDDEDEDDIT